MMNGLITSSVNGLATITLNRPEKGNAMDGPLITALIQALREFLLDETVGALIINGQGEHFCAGADISWMQHVSELSHSENYDDAQLIADMLYLLYSFPKPTIALAHGAVMGGGIGLVAACDIAFAAKQTYFSFPEIKIGITPATISPYVVLAIGERAAQYYFLTSNRFDAEEAHRLGLVHRVCEDDALLSTGVMLGNSLLKNSKSALIAAKQLIRHVSNEKITEMLAQKTAEHLATVRTSIDAKEGLEAFLEKRKPKWGGS